MVAPVSPRLVLATVVLVAALIGGNFSALKFGLDHTTPFLLASMRTVIGGTFLMTLALVRGERFPRRRADLLTILLVAFSITTVSSGLLVFGLVFGVDRVPAGIASLMSATMPLFTAVLSFLLLGLRSGAELSIARLAHEPPGSARPSRRLRRNSCVGIAVVVGRYRRGWDRRSPRCSCRRSLGRSARS